MSAKDGVPPDSSQWRSAPGAVPPCRVHCLGFRNCPAIGNCGRGSDHGARPDDLPALAPGVARSTDLIQATLWWRQFLCLRPRPLPSGFPRPINVKDHAGVSCSINKGAGVSLCGKTGVRADRRERGCARFRWPEALTLARKRERAEREGSFSRSNRAMKGCAKGRSRS